MKLRAAVAAATLVGGAMTLVVFGAADAQQERRSASSSSVASRGKYIVERVAMCGDCHTPRLPSGAPDLSRDLRGADIDFQPVHPIPGWANHAPDITASGLHGMSVRKLAAVLTNAKFDPPMPNYRLNQQDATAVATYLLSLKSHAK